MLVAVESLQHAYDLMYLGGPVLADAALEDLRTTLTNFWQGYQILSVMAFDEGKMRRNTLPKLHYVAGHLADQARLTRQSRVHTRVCI